MTRDRILVVGAGSDLGQALLGELGPDSAIAVTSIESMPLPDFNHLRLGPGDAVPAETLARCAAVINAAGHAAGDDLAPRSATIDLSLTIAPAAKKAGVPRMVHVSSFSVVGTAAYIDGTTEERPINAYGRSEAKAEHLFMGMSSESFSVECIRLPFLFAASKPGLLSPLLSLAKRFRHLPIPAGGPVRRSMITYADAAHQLVVASGLGSSGISFVADPQPFDYLLLKTVLAEEVGVKIRLFPVPQIVVAGTDRLFPALGRRLFRSSLLDPRTNRAGDRPLGLEAELRKLVRSTYGF